MRAGFREYQRSSATHHAALPSRGPRCSQLRALRANPYARIAAALLVWPVGVRWLTQDRLEPEISWGLTGFTSVVWAIMALGFISRPPDLWSPAAAVAGSRATAIPTPYGTPITPVAFFIETIEPTPTPSSTPTESPTPIPSPTPRTPTAAVSPQSTAPPQSAAASAAPTRQPPTATPVPTPRPSATPRPPTPPPRTAAIPRLPSN